jgi:hypothetical protein
MNLQEQLNRIQEMIYEDTNEGWMSDLKSYFIPKKKKDNDESRFTCEDCGDENYKMYMVNDDIWDEYGNKRFTLCMSCLEKRMGRKLTKDDFSQYPNALTNKYNTEVQSLFDENVDTNLREDLQRIHEVMGLLTEEISEEIDSSEAQSSYGSVKTIVDGKRDIAFIQLSPTINMFILLHGLKKMKVPNSKNYIIYRKGEEDKAKELLDIANKYGGFLHYKATDDDSRRIGQLLGYKESDIENYINKNKTLEK